MTRGTIPCSPISPGLPPPPPSQTLHYPLLSPKHVITTSTNHHPSSLTLPLPQTSIFPPPHYQPPPASFNRHLQPTFSHPPHIHINNASSSPAPRPIPKPKPLPPLLPLPSLPPNPNVPPSHNYRSITSNPNQPSNTTKPQHFSKWTKKRIQNIIDNQGVINLYVENLPSRWTAIDVLLFLSRFGEVIDIYIPVKRARNGRRFGFVRFSACNDIQPLISSINLVKVENGTLQALIAHGRPISRKPPHLKSNPPLPPPPSNTINKRSFAETVKVTTSVPSSNLNCVIDKASISFTPLQSETEWLSKSAFGVLSEPMDFQIVSKLFHDHGHHDIKICELGGDSVLIQFPTPTAMHEFIESNSDWVSNFFDLLRAWQLNDGATNRKVWVRAKGIPLHAWSNGFFHTLVSRFGSLISVAPITENKTSLEYAYLQVITTIHKPILWDISVLIHGITFHVRLDEIVHFPPHPSCHQHPPHTSTVQDHITSQDNSPIISKGLKPSPPDPPSSDHAHVACPTTTKSSNQKNSDPFNLMEIIGNTIQPQKCLPCAHGLTSQGCRAIPSCLQPCTCSPACSISKKAVGSTSVINECHSTNISSSESSKTPTYTHVSTNSSIGSSSIYPDVSFNNSEPAPIFKSPLCPTLTRAQSLPIIYLSLPDLPLPSSKAHSNQSKKFTFTSPSPSSSNPKLSLNTSLPFSPTPSSSLDSTLSPRTLSNLIEQKIEAAFKSKRITVRKKVKKIRRGDNISRRSLSDYDTSLANTKTMSNPSETPIPASFCSIEAERTVQVGNLIGWDNTSDPTGTLSAAVALVEQEGFDWSKSHAEMS
ncbi:hypothetical protein Tsubulata_030264 [Turnera subulata]|uniref:RRM domain-containing protein n=1 Tax=Turnera subulata TaxID=218843 RepID=A0A9Q0F824_9ROSI|nr:hypothetical protein Tsubulata_030264 [Turnera subulata]